MLRARVGMRYLGGIKNLKASSPVVAFLPECSAYPAPTRVSTRVPAAKFTFRAYLVAVKERRLSYHSREIDIYIYMYKVNNMVSGLW